MAILPIFGNCVSVFAFACFLSTSTSKLLFLSHLFSEDSHQAQKQPSADPFIEFLNIILSYETEMCRSQRITGLFFILMAFAIQTEGLMIIAIPILPQFFQWTRLFIVVLYSYPLCRHMKSSIWVMRPFIYDFSSFNYKNQQDRRAKTGKLPNPFQCRQEKQRKQSDQIMKLVVMVSQCSSALYMNMASLVFFHIRIIKLISYTNITFHRMKLNNPLTKTLLSDLKDIIDSQILQSFTKRFNGQNKREIHHSKFSTNDTVEATTPSTVDTTLRRRGNAITKSIRPESRSKNKVKQNINQNSEMSVTKLIQKQQQNQQQEINQIRNNPSQLNRKILMDKAVYYGNVELPYLHSSDAIASIYQRPKGFEKTKQQILINPPSNVSPHFLTNVKNLYLYYTSIDTLRQLGTGWSNLKSLTIMCSSQLKDLSGLSIFPSLEYLFVPHNNIKEISDLMYHSSLRCVDLQDNKIDLIDQIEYLYTINNLQWVDISQNPITAVKEKYRIISENLGNKMQSEQSNKVFEYQISQKALDWEIYSYENISISNHLIKEINEQILKQEIVVGSYWRSVRQKYSQEDRKDGPDVQILATFYENDQSAEQLEELKLRVSPFTNYFPSSLNFDSLKKYFYNKICPQIRSDKEKQEKSSRITGKQEKEREKQQKQGKIQVERTTMRRFALTQKLSSAVSQEKQRLTSGSLKKKLSRISMSKNLNLATPLNFLKLKEEGAQSNGNGNSIGMKLIGKRKLANKNHGQLTGL